VVGLDKKAFVLGSRFVLYFKGGGEDEDENEVSLI